MSYEKAVVSTVIPTALTTVSATFPLKSEYCKFEGFRCLSTGDALVTLRLKDGDGRVFYLDAADKDYTTARDKFVVYDNTNTGLGVVVGDLTGAANTGIQGTGQVIVRSPITVTYTNGTAADTELLWFYYKSGFERSRLLLTTPNPAATISGSVMLKNKFSRIIAFSASNVTDVASSIKLTDADSRDIYVDAADRDYRAATAVNMVSIAPDDTLTNITPQTLDATGAAAGAAEGGSPGTAVAKSPITVTWSNNGTAGDVLTIDLLHEV